MSSKKSQFYQDYAQILRSRGTSVKHIAEKLGACQKWVYQHTDNLTNPPFDNSDLIEIVRDLIFQISVSAHKDGGENPKEFAWALSQYASVLKSLEEVALTTGRRNMTECIKELHRRFADQGVPDELMEILQTEYDRELAG